MPIREHRPVSADPGWDDLTMAGSSAYQLGDFATAAAKWNAALNFTGKFTDDDPRKAASLNNVGIGRMLTQTAGAKVLLRNANRTWRHLLDYYASPLFVPELSGRGSVFHIKLASRHATAFAHHHQARVLSLCCAAAAISKFNYVVATKQAPPTYCRKLYGQVEAAFGANCKETAQLARMVNGDPPHQHAAPLPLYLRWQELRSSRSGAIYNVLAAAHLTALIDLSLLRHPI